MEENRERITDHTDHSAEFETLSCFLISKDNKARRWMIQLIKWPWFERISMSVILINCLTLAMYNPLDKDCKSTRCQVLENVEIIVFAFFSAEMIIKMIAMGVTGKKGYLQDKWNRLDCFIVIIGVIEKAVVRVNGNYLTIIRAFRVLRPLRAINKVPSIRILVTLLLDTLPMLGNVLLLSFLIFFVFGIIGVQLWQGKLRNRCFTEFPENSTFLTRYNKSQFYQPSFSNPDFVCSLSKDYGTRLCSDIEPKEENVSTKCPDSSGNVSAEIKRVTFNWSQYYNKCKTSDQNPFYNTTSFDNIGIAWIAIFQVITLEGWSDIMYFVQDAHSFWNWIYFVVLIVMGSFFLVNLCLVVITMQFQETKAREIELMENSKGEQSLESPKLLKTLMKYLQHFCNCKPQEKEHVHHHHHHFYHHHHFHHHLYNCFVPPSPVIGTDHEAAAGDPSFFPDTTNFPKIQVEAEETTCSHSCVEESPILQDFLAPPFTRQSSRRSSRTSICSHALSIHAETSSAVSIEEIVTQAKTSVTLNIPSSPVATFFAFSSDNNASRKNSTQSRKREFSASTLTSAEINPHHARTSTSQSEDVFSKTSKEATESSIQRKDKEPLKYRRFSQPAHAKLARTPASEISFQPSKSLETKEADDYRDVEANPEMVNFDVISSLESDLEKSDATQDPPSNDLVSTSQANDCQIDDTVNTTLKRPSLKRRDIPAQSEDDMFESLLNLRQSATYDVTGNHSAWRKLRIICRKTIESKQFTISIMGAILLNMICMGLEHYEQPDRLTVALENINIIFVSIFGIEMVIKLLGYGVTSYLSEGQNVFDGLIVTVSVCEILLTKGASLSIFRSIRLLRIFKLVRPVRYQLLVVVKTMTSVMTFFGLLFLFIFAFAILGMNLFGGKFIFKNAEGKQVTSRSNFDDFLWAMVTVFQILTQENWNLVMYDGMRATSHWAALYFIALMAVGYYVLFNLLVAILVEGFTNSGKRKTTPKNEPGASKNEDAPKPAFKEVEKPHILISCKDSEEPCPGHYQEEPVPEFCSHGVRNALGSTFQLRSNYTPSLSLATLEPLQDKKPPTAAQPTEANMTMPQLKRMRQASASIIRKTGQMAHRTDWRHDEPIFSVHNRGFLGDDMETRGKLHLEVSERERCNKAGGKTLEEIVSPTIACSLSFPNQSEGTTSYQSRPESPHMIFQNNSSDEMYQPRECHLPEAQECTKKVNKITRKRSDWSLFLFSPSNSFRRAVMAVCEHKYFDYVVLAFILISCVVLALEEPNIPRNSKKRQIIDIAMLILTVIFTIEMLMKIIAQGFLLGAGTYLKDGWNILDGILVLFSWIDVILTYSPADAPEVLGALKVFRALRTLRPLRMIRRAPGLKLVVQTLLFSLKPIGNTVLIAAIFFVMFGILGVQIFKGTFYHCEGDSEVKDKKDCRGEGCWQNRMYNFDNLFNALISLFVFSTRDGWVEIMHHGIDAVGIDKQPIKNYREWRLAYFIPFLMLGGFLVLNMIVGVVVENFQRCRERLEDEEQQRRRRKLLEKARDKNQEEVDRTYYESYSPWRRHIHDMCLHLYWDVAIAIVICLNVLCMSLEHYQMSKAFQRFVDTANYFFAAVFVLEVIFKFIAFGFVRFFKDRWNIIDLVIVILSLTGILIQSLRTTKALGAKVPINPTVARSLRVLRIIRVLKLVKLAKGVRSLLDTLFEALPQVANLGLLFLLLFFIYACLGIQLFGKLDCTRSSCQGLGPHAHFKDFGTAMLTLFRIATGDNWNGILEDALRLSCGESAECVSRYIAQLFFVTFVLAAQFVLVNVVIAVLMKHLKESKEKIAANMAAKDLEKKLKLLTTTAKNFILAKAKKNDLSISRRRSIVQIGLGGIELTQLKHGTPMKNIDSSFRAEFAKADAIFQEFLLLHENLQKVKMTICRTASHNIEVTPTPVTPSLRQRCNSFCGVRELHSSEYDLGKFTVYKSGAKL